MKLLPLLALAALALAGCSGGKGSAGADVPDAFDGVQAATGKGVIRGVVVTPAIAPVAGAQVEVAGTGLGATTDEDGAFVFVDLEPGTHFLAVSKPGWTSVQQSVEVVANDAEPPIVKVSLEEVPGTEPRVERLHMQGFMACSVGTPINYASCAVTEEEDPNLYFEIPGAPRWIQTEIVWESTQPSGDWLYVVQGVCSCDGGVPDVGPGRFNETAEATSPHIARADPAFLAANDVGSSADAAQLVVSISASGPEPDTTNGSGVALNQAFEVYVTFFYNFDPDPAWAFVTDGPYPVPSGG